MNKVSYMYKKAVADFIANCKPAEGFIPGTEVPKRCSDGSFASSVMCITPLDASLSRLKVRSPIIGNTIITATVTGYPQPKNVTHVDKTSLVIAATLIWRHVAIRSVEFALIQSDVEEAPVTHEMLTVDVWPYLSVVKRVRESLKGRTNKKNVALYTTLASSVIGTHPTTFALVDNVNVVPEAMRQYKNEMCLVGRDEIGGSVKQLIAELRNTDIPLSDYESGKPLRELIDSNFEMTVPRRYLVMPDIGKLLKVIYTDPFVMGMFNKSVTNEERLNLARTMVSEHIIKNVVPKISLTSEKDDIVGYGVKLCGRTFDYDDLRLKLQWDDVQCEHDLLHLSLIASDAVPGPEYYQRSTSEDYAKEIPRGTPAPHSVNSFGLVPRYQDVAIVASRLLKTMIRRSNRNKNGYSAVCVASAVSYLAYDMYYKTQAMDNNFMTFFVAKSFDASDFTRIPAQKSNSKRG